MRKFLINIFTFILTSISILLCIWLIYKQRLNEVKLRSDASIIVCGDSHVQCAINDSILHGAINISESSQHYLYTYNILKLLIQNNPQIKLIILGCSFHSFAEYYNNLFIKNNETYFQYPMYFSILDYESMLKILLKNPIGLFMLSVRIYKNIIHAVIKNSANFQDYPFCGGYYKSNRNNLNDSTIITAIKRHYYLNNKLKLRFACLQKLYLKKIIEICNKSKIKLVVINTPVNENYYKKIPKKIISDYYYTMLGFDKKISFFDLHSYKIGNEGFGDGDHLNSIGSEKFTLKVDSLLIESK